MIEFIVGFFLGIGVGFYLGYIFLGLPAPPKSVKMKLEDIPEEEFLAIAMAFGAEMERRMELHERGEIQEETKPFEEYDGKE